MPQLPPKVLFPVAKDEHGQLLQQALMNWFTKIIDLMNKGLRFEDNQDAEITSYTTNGVADTEDTVAHTLKRVPTGFLVLNTDKAAVVYDSGTAWTATNIYLKCSVATTAVKVMIF
jgi:hypothetical protein